MADESKLDFFLPDAEVLQGVKRQLIDAGIDSRAIPQDWLAAICAAFVKQISTKKEGYSYISRLLNFHWQQGSNTKEFIILDDNGNEYAEADHDDVVLVSGCLVKGKPIHPSRVRIRRKPEYRCDDCGSRTFCVTEVFNYHKDRIESLCNMCLKFSEEPKHREQYNSSLCADCGDLNCVHNPKLEEHKQENATCQDKQALVFGRT